jgi:hypothetical protein
LLTTQSQAFYFALQDLLGVTCSIAIEWRADRSEGSAGDAVDILRRILKAKTASEASGVLDYFSTSVFENWQQEGVALGKRWRTAIKELAESWTELNERERFATLQQVGSKLRSCLVNDLESRER